jgi:cytochrome o ubiquinol oxidase subunit 2
MRFAVRAVTSDAYARWVADTKSAGGRALDATAYAELLKPSKNVQPTTYRAIAPGLFQSIVEQTAADESPHPGGPGGRDAPSPRKGT